ncbi:phage baseplate assembly protein [Shewanella khirikhana]|uniref:Phage late control gene D protein (GPD) n=1 Tax=Shewanella khirikhana TaxID=1965282 RepID=A0ABN5TRP5_9GAMM|nr:contractile injection system protein, VgrG/Pvc8 family [Shewanella khirikhana]AZQ10168.1 Phage late control gene D protein (GPD) [Shewanella khirikhana]
MADNIILKAGGNIYQGWTKISVTRSLEAMSGTFDLELTWKWQGQAGQYEKFMEPIKQGQQCTVDIGSERVITGYVDDWIPSYDDTTVTISVSGRDKTADLVDCSVDIQSGQLNNQTLSQIANLVCKPFGIEVVVNTDVGEAFQRIQVEQGETPHELLSRLARQRGVLLTSDTFGNLVITRASKTRAGVALKLGENIKAGRGRFSWRQRYSKFTVKAAGAGHGAWDSAALSTVGGIKADVTDTEIGRYRPLIIVNEEITTAEGAAKRGQWERQRSIGKSNTVEYTVTGWRIPQTGNLWDINTLVPVSDEIMGIEEDMLIASLMFSEGDDGRLTVISVVRPDAMDIPAQVVSNTKLGGGQW